MLETVQILTGQSPSVAVIWMHGLGADGHDFEPIVPMLPLVAPLRFVFPNAPERPVTLNGGMPLRAWYDIDPRSPLSGTDDIRASADAIAALVAREVARGVPARRITLAGFSQGGVIALALGLRHPDRLAGIMALSTYLQDRPTETQQLWMTAYGVGSTLGVMLPYSRTHESEADHMGLIFMAKAGYNPEAAVSFWERMAAKGGSTPEFLSTHPSDARRVADLKRLMPEALKQYRPR